MKVTLVPPQIVPDGTAAMLSLADEEFTDIVIVFEVEPKSGVTQDRLLTIVHVIRSELLSVLSVYS